MSAHEGDDPTQPRRPSDLIDELCGWIADQLGDPRPERKNGCRPVPTSRRCA
ncbi:hypothetical protein AB0893_02100 [Micromonospora aurantiaca]|uniref:hypothetical protein n=1 Tax=Micromonospora aurantiaca (nom. illeg.) TaxID=47850 RepID=UPI00345587E8